MAFRRLKKRIAAEDGFTLAELLVATVTGLIVVGAAASLFTAAIRSEPAARERTAAIQEARTMSEALTRELRQGSNAAAPTPGQLSILTFVPHAACGSPTTGAPTRCKVFYS